MEDASDGCGHGGLRGRRGGEDSAVGERDGHGEVGGYSVVEVVEGYWCGSMLRKWRSRDVCMIR